MPPRAVRFSRQTGKIMHHRPIVSLTFAVLLLVSMSNCTLKDTSITLASHSQIQTGQSWQTIQSGNRERFFLAYIPTTYDDSDPVPLVLNFHGSRSNPFAQMAYSNLTPLAEEEGFIVAFPFGEYGKERGVHSWNADKDPAGVDDVQFSRDIVADLEKRLSIDRKRIYVTGFSGGARMASRLACDLDKTVAAVAPVAGVQYPLDCQASRAVPLIVFHGKQDLVNTYVHTSLSRDYWRTGVEESLDGWVQKNGCNNVTETTPISKVVTRIAWEDCRDESEIIFYSIENGGHTWPGSPIVMTQPWSGETNQDIVAVQLIWDFFKDHPLP